MFLVCLNVRVDYLKTYSGLKSSLNRAGKIKNIKMSKLSQSLAYSKVLKLFLSMYNVISSPFPSPTAPYQPIF